VDITIFAMHLYSCVAQFKDNVGSALVASATTSRKMIVANVKPASKHFNL